MEKTTNDSAQVSGPPVDYETRLVPARGNESIPQEGSPFKSYLRVFTYNDAAGWAMNAAALICMIASGALLPLMDLVFGQFVTVFNNFVTGQGTPDDFRRGVNHYTLYFVYLFIAKFVLVYAWTTLVSGNAIRVTCALRLDFLRHTLRQEIGFFDSSESGSISGSITNDGNLVNQGISEKLGLTIQAISTFVAAFVVAFAVQWKLTLITICIVPAILIVTCVCVVIDTEIENKMMSTYARADQVAEEVFASIRNVHAFWAYPKLLRKYERILDEARVVARNKSPVYAIWFSVEFFCVYAGYGLAFWQGIRMYNRGEITQPGNIVTVIFAVLLAAQALTQIAPQGITISKASAAAHQLFRTIDRDSKIDALSTEGMKPADCRGDIEFRNVVFAYPSRPDVQVLKALDLVIPANKTTAIVGPSGSGKSTIIGLLERWFSPLSGSITLDGHRIEDVNIQWLRTNIRLVQQEPVMFNGTIFQNVAYGLSGTPQADLPDDEKHTLVENACRAAYAHEFIERLPKGYQTQIGERGAMLSGGQKQRLAIARSVISSPRVLLLDEATSALDPNAERIVQQALNNVAVGRTMVVIAHRLSTIRDADNIVVMSGGVIVEQGTHDELIELKGAYSRLVLAQDLGQGSNQETVEQDASLTTDGEKIAITKTGSSAGLHESETPFENGPALNYGLLKCVAMIVKEQRSLRMPFVAMSLVCIAGGVTYPALAVLFSRILDAFALTGDAMVQRGDFYSLMFFVVALGNLVVYAFLGWMSSVISQGIMKHYRLEIFDSILRHNMAFFDEPRNTTGALVSWLSTEPNALQELLSFNLGLILIIIVNLISSCILAIVFGWKLGVVLVFGALPPLVFSGYLRIRLEAKLDDDTSARFADSAGIASEAALAIRTVASLALEREILAKYGGSLRSIATSSIKSLAWKMFWYSLSQSIPFLAMALGFWYGGTLISYGEYTSQQFYTVFIAVIFSGEAAAGFFTYTTSLTKARAAANYVFGLRRGVSKDMMDDHPPGRKSSGDGAVALECKDLEFAYPRRPGVRVLKGVSPSIRPGQFVAFVGASGCGKTTMISLLERFYEPTGGDIHFDGVNTKSIHLGQYRRDIALVQQEPVLYQGSLRENIALGLEGPEDGEVYAINDDDILAACRQANIETFISSLPDGLSTPCGSQGLQFSGGQRQRVAIARALIRNPRLLLLDEATSSLDTESEKVVQAALNAAAKGEGSDGRKRTTVAVAHRLSTIKEADSIFVFAHGRIAEVGNHEELLERKGIYYQMCLGQSLDRAA